MATRFPGGLKRKELSPRIFSKLSNSFSHSLSAGHLGSGRHIRGPDRERVRGSERERERETYFWPTVSECKRTGDGEVLRQGFLKWQQNRMQSEPGLQGEGVGGGGGEESLGGGG